MTKTSLLSVIKFVLFLSVVEFGESEYNLIDTNPSCLSKGLCSYGLPGMANSIHPNSEERTQYILRNIARLYPNNYINSKYGKYQFGTFGDQTVYHDEGYCGIATQRPMYWHSDGNQLARFHQWDADNCDGLSIGHSTCPKRCYLFNDDCSFGARADAFVGDDGAYAASEGLWGANMGYEDGHCGAVFDPKYIYHGIGFWPYTNGVAAVYLTGGPDINYPLVQAAHFDERIKINRNDLQQNSQHLTFMVEYYGVDIGNQDLQNMYVLYDGNYHAMNRIFGTALSGFYELHFAIPTICKPYAFVAITENDDIYRLPQDEDYFFGTAWSEWDWWSPDDDCKENHYYNNGDKWIPNGSDEWNNNNACVGCIEIDSLVQIYNDFDDSDTDSSDSEETTTTYPTDSPTMKPTLNPTDTPTSTPTNTPDPTYAPTDKPTNQPTNKATNKPTENPIDPQIGDTESPTNSPSNKPTNNPTNKPTNEPTQETVRTPSPTYNPTNRPTTKPQETPTAGSYFDCSSESCIGSVMECSDNDHCYVDCSYHYEACQDAEIHCPTTKEYECIVECNGYEACDRVKIYGEHSKILTLACGDYPESCQDIDVYCPVSTTVFAHIPTCFISGHNDFVGMRVYAHHGFGDIEFDVSDSLDSSRIYCDFDYSTGSFQDSCIIEPEPPNMSCQDGLQICDGQFPEEPETTTTTEEPEIFESSYFDCRVESCNEHILKCSNDEDCYIDCGFDEGESCQDTIIHCPENHKCVLFCDEKEACDRANVYAQQSEYFYLICENYDESCNGMNIYCPQNQDKTCEISGYNDFEGMNIYTLYGMANLILNIEDEFEDVTIHCGGGYIYSCNILNIPPYNQCDSGTVAGTNNQCEYIQQDTLSPEPEPEVTALTLRPTESPITRKRRGKRYRLDDPKAAHSDDSDNSDDDDEEEEEEEELDDVLTQ